MSPGVDGVRLTWWGHACVRLDGPGGAVVIDPGSFSETGPALAGAAAVLVTHEHGDHVVPEVLVAALAADPALEVWAPDAVLRLLDGAPTDRLHPVVGGDRFTAAGLDVLAVGDRHAEIHRDLPDLANVGYLLAGVYHPGDALVVPPEPVRTLLVPVAGPWLRLADAVDLVRAVAPVLAVPVHTAPASEIGLGLADRVVGGLGGVPWRRPVLGEAVEV